MGSVARGVDLEKWSTPAVGLLLFMALFAFWPTYLTSPTELGTRYTHIHAGTAALWFVLLLVQPLLLRLGRRALHRRLGYVSVIVAPAVVVGIALGAHGLLGRLRSAGAWDVGVYVLYLQVGLGIIFAVAWGLAMRYRENRKVHARFMVATGVTFVDPVLARLLPDGLPVNNQVVTFAVVNVILLSLIWSERDARRGRWVFPAVLGMFVLFEVPLALGITRSAWWEAFARWYLTLPLT